MKFLRATQKGLSLIPMLVLSTLMALFVLSNSNHITLNQKNTGNINYQRVVKDNINEELKAQLEWYTDIEHLTDINSSGDVIAKRGAAPDTIVDGNISRKPFLINCPGTSFSCVNYKMEVTVDQKNIMASKTHYIEFSSIQPN